MAVELVMPRLSESMEEGTIVSWLVADGASVVRGQEIAEIETDKATLPYEAPESGVLRILVPQGSTLALGEPIGLIDDLSALPGGQSVAPPGLEGATRGRVPAPRAPDDEPPTASFEIQPDLHAPPHTQHASFPPPQPAASAEWSPAWGPQPARAQRFEPAHLDDEGETTEFDIIDDGLEPGEDEEPYLPLAAPRQVPVEPQPAPVPQPAEPVFQPAAPAPPAPVAQTPEPVFQPAVPAPQPEPVAQAAPAAPPMPLDAQPPLPWVDPSFSPKPATAVAIGAPGAAEVPALEPALAAQEAAAQAQAVDHALAAQVEPAAAPVQPVAMQPQPVTQHVQPVAPVGQPIDPAAAGAPVVEDGRFSAAELMTGAGPATLPPRPPELRPAPGVGAARVAASPVARRLAREMGIDLSTIEGTGPEGRVVRADIEAAQATGAARPPKQAGATPSVASEFTPPVDEARAAAPIPEVEPGGEPEPEAAPDVPAAPQAIPGEPTADADRVDEAVADPVAEPEAAQPEPAEPAVAQAPVDDDPSAAGDDADLLAVAETDADEPSVPADLPAVEEGALESTPEPEPELAADAPADQALTADTASDDLEQPAVDADADEPSVPIADAAPEAPAAPPISGGKGEPEAVELSRQQQTVARRMAESKATIPDFHTVVEVDAAPLQALRAELRATRPDLAAPSVNDWLVKATAVALRSFPSLNGAYRDGRLERYPKINIGIAVDADGTLLVPVVHDADLRSIGQIAARTSELIGKARDGSLRPPDIASATFTLSNLGTFGVEQFTAVITPGQAAILTAGAIAERPVVRDGALVAGTTLRLTLTTDHRAVYGADAARFLGRLRELLERPSGLLA